MPKMPKDAQDGQRWRYLFTIAIQGRPRFGMEMREMWELWELVGVGDIDSGMLAFWVIGMRGNVARKSHLFSTLDAWFDVGEKC
jgi:hypothetical protein